MALETASRTEVGQRVAWLRKQADLNGRDAALLIGVDDPGLFSRIELHGRSFDYERLVDIANVFAGRGQLVDEPKALFNFILFGGEVVDVLRPQFRLEREAQPAPALRVIEGRKSRNGAKFDPAIGKPSFQQRAA